jgi:hypothetical protein
VTTATLRPGLLRRTLESFRPFLEQGTWRLLLNIDPVGEPGVRPREILAIARDYFPKIELRQPARASFPAAWYWAVANLRAEYVFWLEDDWELLRPVELAKMVEIMDEEPDLATMRLPRWDATDIYRQWNRRKLADWRDGYGEIPLDLRLHCGYSNNPSLTRREFLQPMLPHFSGPTDPEKQIAGFNPVLRHWVGYAWRYGVFQEPHTPAAVRDIGEQWRKQHNVGKGRNKVRFQTWEHHDFGRGGQKAQLQERSGS